MTGTTSATGVAASAMRMDTTPTARCLMEMSTKMTEYDEDTRLCWECGDPLSPFNEDLCDWCDDSEEDEDE